MKRSIVSLAAVAVLTLSACSSTKDASSPPPAGVSPGTQTAISDQLAVSDFKRRGIKVVYSLTGKLEAIEVVGYAPLWGRSQNSAREAYRVAELEAKKSLNDFINQEVISTETSVKMFSRNVERARDHKVNDFATNRNRDIVSSIESDEEPKDDKNYNREVNTGTRQDGFAIATVINNTIKTRNQGILGGLYLVEGEVIDNGRTVRVVYRWDDKHNKQRGYIRQQMMQ
jgi:hypothetical protein